MISVFTPYHLRNTTFLQEAYESIKKQTFSDWEWVILLNGDARNMSFKNSDFKIELASDKRVKIVNAPISVNTEKNIGFLKNTACGICKGDVLIEYDFDDLLTPDCLQEVHNAFLDTNIQMAYSNFCLFEDKTWKPDVYSSDYGWKDRDFIYERHALKEMIAFPPTAQAIRRIEWSPNHVRAWRKSSYEEILGHDIELKTGDDHDLCCRYYLRYGEKGIRHIDKCLYLYRHHDKNTSRGNRNSEVQEQTDKNYLKYCRPMATRWAKDNNLRMIDLGGNTAGGFEAYRDFGSRWAFEDNSVGVIRANNFMAEVDDFVQFMNEAYRVLAGGGWLFLEAPSTDGRGAFQDPRTKIYLNENSIWYYTQRNYANFIPEFKGRFQLSRKCTWYPSAFQRENDIKVVEADLICLKPPYSDRPAGEVLI